MDIWKLNINSRVT